MADANHTRLIDISGQLITAELAVSMGGFQVRLAFEAKNIAEIAATITRIEEHGFRSVKRG